MSKEQLLRMKRAVEESRNRTALSNSQSSSQTSSPVHNSASNSPSPARQYEPVQQRPVEDDQEVIIAKRKLTLEQERLKIEKESLEAEKEALRISKERLEIDKMQDKINNAKDKNKDIENEKLQMQKEIREEKEKLHEQIEQLTKLTNSIINHEKLNEIILVKDQRAPDISGEIDHITRIIEQINNTVSKATDFVEQREAAITGELNEFTIL